MLNSIEVLTKRKIYLVCLILHVVPSLQGYIKYLNYLQDCRILQKKEYFSFDFPFYSLIRFAVKLCQSIKLAIVQCALLY
jgi:hypothetical protein